MGDCNAERLVTCSKARRSTSIYPIASPQQFMRDTSDIEDGTSAAERSSYSEYTSSTSTAWLVPLLVIADVTIFIVTMFLNDCPRKSTVNNQQCVARLLGSLSFQPWHQNPLLGPSTSTLLKVGALESNLAVRAHQGWRLLTCMWLHAGLFHLICSVFTLILIGLRLEQEHGALRIGAIMLLSGFGGSIFSALFLYNQVAVGGSALIFGLLGAMCSEIFNNWMICFNKCAVISTIAFLAVMNFVLGTLPNISNFSHVGGFIYGFLLGILLLMKHGPMPHTEPPPAKSVNYKNIVWILALSFLVCGSVAVIAALSTGVNLSRNCSWCHALECVETSYWKCPKNKFI